MPRRRHRHRRLEWTNSMQSHITLIDIPLEHQQQQAASPQSVPVQRAATYGADTFGADNFAADQRPLLIRSTTPQVHESRRATRTQTLPASSAAETPTSTVFPVQNSVPKDSVGFVRRLTDSLKRQLRSLKLSVRNLPEGTTHGSGYYSVSVRALRALATRLPANVIELAIESDHDMFKLARRIACVFCNAQNLDRIVYQDDEFLVFHDIKPDATLHLLVIPREHFGTIKELNPDDLPMVSRMLAIGRRLLDERGFKDNKARFGFHRPPFNSVHHLHMHCLGLPFKPKRAEYMFPRKGSAWFMPADRLCESLLEQTT
ncbi:hypothetical protein GGI07_001591 [Coemansia sp. Benny D115]|nr:hypothetical protein GGI07_001591 [Coemansia sp. Benny D115]